MGLVGTKAGRTAFYCVEDFYWPNSLRWTIAGVGMESAGEAEICKFHYCQTSKRAFLQNQRGTALSREQSRSQNVGHIAHH